MSAIIKPVELDIADNVRSHRELFGLDIADDVRFHRELVELDIADNVRSHTKNYNGALGLIGIAV